LRLLSFEPPADDTGQGNRTADGTVNNRNSLMNDVNGEGSFLSLPPKQRELIMQAMTDKLPPEYAAIIQQYYVNIAQGKAQEDNQQRGQGNRQADGTLKNSNSYLNDVNGDGSFLSLPPRQRELIRQALSDKLPPEYAAIIQQYYVNIAQGKAATKPATNEPGKDKDK